MNWLTGLTAVLLMVAAVAIWVIYRRQSRGQQRLAAMHGGTARSSSVKPSDLGAKRLRDQAPLISALLRATPMWETLQVQILRAGWLLRPSELIATMAGAGLLGVATGWVVTHSWLNAVIIGAFAAAMPWTILKVCQAKRAKALSAQIPDALDMLTSAMRSGFTFLRGLQLIESQMHPPIAQELGRVVDEVQFGMAIAEALDNLVMRTEDYDLELIVAAVQTQLEVGGNLAEVLDNIGGMVRERVKLTGELSTATAEGRLSAGILLGMPFAIAIMVNILNPAYMRPLFTTSLGLVLVGVGGFLMLTGALILRQLVRIDI